MDAQTSKVGGRIVTLLLLIAGFMAVPSFAQLKLVNILSPSSGVVVRPGQTIMISVTADASVEKLALLGQNPLGVGVVVSSAGTGVVVRGRGESLPIQFQLQIPSDIQPGTYQVTAITPVSGGEMVSDALTLDVERAEEPLRTWTEPFAIQVAQPGDRIPVRVLGTFADGSKEELTRSKKTTYTSGDLQVATVSADGMVTAIGPGKTTIEVRTPSQTNAFPVRVQSR
jgi:hypothetical protein